MTGVCHRFRSAIDGAARRFGGVLFALVLLILASTSSRSEQTQQHVLMLHAYNYTFPATTIVSESIRYRLLEKSPNRLEIDADFLDLARRPDPALATLTANYLAGKYDNTKFDAVVVIGTGAIPFVIEHRDAFAKGAPVIFVGGLRTDLANLQLPTDFRGVIPEFRPEKILELALHLQPHARRVVVIGGSSKLDRPWQDATREAFDRNTQLEKTYLFDLSAEAMLSEVSRLPPDTIVIVLTAYADANGKRLIPRDVAAAISKASSAPVYGPFETFLGTGIVGGYMETYASLGETVADVTLQVLAGQIDAIEPAVRNNAGQAYRVDWRALQRWSLPPNNLPADTIVLFKEPGIWEQYSLPLSAIALVFVLQTLLVGSLLLQRRRRREAERSLMDSEARMAFAASSANIGLWQFNRKTDELWATEHCRKMLGLHAGAPLTRTSFLTAIHPEDREGVIASLRSAGHRQSLDVRVMLADDQIRWFRIRSVTHLDPDGSPSQLAGIIVDLTRQKQAEAEIALQRQQMTHLMRVSVLGELSGAIAHEINQPLTAIMSNAHAALELLKQDLPDLPEIREALKEIATEDSRAGKIIQRLRALIKKGENRFEPTDVNQIVESTINLLHSELIARGVRPQTNLARGLPRVSGDFVQLQQVLINLIVNAIDAMAGTVATARVISLLTSSLSGGTVEIRVKDNGTGVAPAARKRLFDPFYTTKDHGLGLGLSICVTIVQAHGGELTVRNDAHGGAVAIVTLPGLQQRLSENPVDNNKVVSGSN